jgi:hypothetical protein
MAAPAASVSGRIMLNSSPPLGIAERFERIGIDQQQGEFMLFAFARSHMDK